MSNTSRRYLRSATHGDLLVPRTRTVYMDHEVLLFQVLLSGTTLPSTLRVSTTTLGQFQSDNTVSFGLRDMIRRFRDCLGR